MSPRTEKQYEQIREQKRALILETALRLFADEAEKSGDYTLALIYLDEIISMIQENQLEIESFESLSELSLPTQESETIFRKELLTGMDFSKQEYHLTFSSKDSAYTETINNPYGGLKVRWNQFSPNEYDTKLDVVIAFITGKLDLEPRAGDYSIRRNRSPLEFRLKIDIKGDLNNYYMGKE